MFQHVGAEDVVEAAMKGRETVVEVGRDELDPLRRFGAGQVDGGDVEPAGGEDLGEVAAGASRVEEAEAAPVGGEFAEQQAVACVRSRLELVLRWRSHARGDHRHYYTGGGRLRLDWRSLHSAGPR